MKNKYVKILIIIAAFLVLSLVTTASYAYFTATIQGNDNINDTVITSGDLSLYFADNGAIKLANAYPSQTIEKEFGIVNIGSSTASYDVYLSNIINTFADKNDLVYTIEAVDPVGLYETAIHEMGCENLNERVVPSVVGEESKIVSSCQINPGVLHTYRITITFKDDGTNQDDNKGKKFAAMVSVNDYYDNLEQIAILENGQKFNKELKMLAGDSDISVDSLNTNVKRIEYTSTEPTEQDNYIYVESGHTATDIKAWFDTDTIYLYSPQDTIYLSENASYIFAGFSELTYLDLSHFDTSRVTNMDAMFYQLKSITSLDVSHFDTSNVESMDMMFSACNKVQSITLGQNFNTSKVTNMRSMFHNTYVLDNLDLSMLDTTKVTNMSWMFCACGVSSLDLSSFDTSNVTNMHGMITNMSKIETLNLGNNFDTSKVTDMFHLFRNLQKLRTLDLGDKFSVASVEDASGLFMQESSPKYLTTIKSNKDLVFNSGTLTNQILYKASNIVGGYGTTYKTNMNSIQGVNYAVIDCGTKRPGYLTYRGTQAEYEAFCSQFN